MRLGTGRRPREAATALAAHIQLTTDALLDAQRQTAGA
jgi:hypothetical protein